MDHDSLAAAVDAGGKEADLAAAVQAALPGADGKGSVAQYCVTKGTPIITCGTAAAGILVPGKGALWNVAMYDEEGEVWQVLSTKKFEEVGGKAAQKYWKRSCKVRVMKVLMKAGEWLETKRIQ